MQSDLAIAVGCEAVAACTQPLANLAIAVELAVDDQMNGAILAGHRLLTVIQADDGQARVTEGPAPIARRPTPRTVGSAMLQAPESRVPAFQRESATGHRGKDSAHQVC